MKIIFLNLFLSFLFFSPLQVRAENPCTLDRDKYCASAKKGAEAMRCLKDNEDKLSEACKKFRIKQRDQGKEIREVCEADRERFCKGERRRGVLACLQKNASHLQAKCKAGLEQLEQ